MHQPCLFGCQDFLPYVSVVMPPLLNSAQLKQDVTITSNSYVDIDESDDESIETITLGDKRIGIRTSVLEEKATACNMLCCYADELKEGFFPWIDQVAPTLVPLLKFYFHEEFRKVAVSAMPELLRSAKLAVEKGQTPGCDESYVKQLSDYIIPALVEAMHKNYYNVYGGVAPAQYPQMYGAAGTTAGAFYPYYQIGQHGTTGAAAGAYGHSSNSYASNFQGYNTMQYPQMFQYSPLASPAVVTGFGQQYYGGGSMPLASTTAAQSGQNSRRKEDCYMYF